MAVIKAARMPPGLASIFMECVRQFAQPRSELKQFVSVNGRFVPSAVRLGSRGDSYYEYLLYVSIFYVNHTR